MFKVEEIIKATAGRLIAGPSAASALAVSTDSRAIKKGNLFFAIRGERFDGHDFIADALRQGAAGAVISDLGRLSPIARKLCFGNKAFVISVGDTLAALGDLARYHRRRFDIPVVAVTGSNGKTTAKEMIFRALHDGWRPLKNPGTQNNFIGVPLALFGLSDRYGSAVIELGMNRPGEIKRLAEIAMPNIGVVTNIGPSHLEHLNSLDAVFKAKGELLSCLGRGDIALLNNDDTYLSAVKSRPYRIYRFGIVKKVDFRATAIARTDKGYKFRVNDEPYELPSIAYHDIYNGLAAVSIGSLFNVTARRMRKALREYVPLEKRMNEFIFSGIKFIDDTYNSNPFSLESAIMMLASSGAKRKRKILVCGDMLELGKRAGYYHSRIGRLVASSGIDDFIGVGDLIRKGIESARRCGMRAAVYCATKEDAAAALKERARPNDIVLVKGSRATRMEDVIRCFTTSYTL